MRKIHELFFKVFHKSGISPMKSHAKL